MSSNKKTPAKPVKKAPEAKPAEAPKAKLKSNPKVFAKAFVKSFVWVGLICTGIVFVFYKMDGFPVFKYWAKNTELPTFSVPAEIVVTEEEGEEVIPYAGAEMTKVDIENLSVAPAELMPAEAAAQTEDTKAMEELAAMRKELAQVQMDLIARLAAKPDPKPQLNPDFVTAMADLRMLEINGGNPDFTLKALRQSAPEQLKAAVQALSVALPGQLLRTADVVTKAQQVQPTSNLATGSVWERWIKIEKVDAHSQTSYEQFNQSRQACVQEILAATIDTPACDEIGVNVALYVKQAQALDAFWQQVEGIE